MPSPSIFIRAAEAVSSADRLIILSGAGMGVDSGLPDFRGNQGFWKAYPPYRALGLSFTDMASPQWFSRSPEMAWGFYGHRLNLYRNTRPHDGFRILRRWADHRDGAFLYTSNVDGQFQKAGFDPLFIVECHGSIHHCQCMEKCGLGTIPADDIHVRVNQKTMKGRRPLPACPRCGSLLRPNILMFGDWEYAPRRCRDQEKRFESWLSERASRRGAIIEVGAGCAVPTVRMQSEYLSRVLEWPLIRINPRDPRCNLPGSISVPSPGKAGIEGIDRTLREPDRLP